VHPNVFKKLASDGTDEATLVSSAMALSALLSLVSLGLGSVASLLMYGTERGGILAIVLIAQFFRSALPVSYLLDFKLESRRWVVMQSMAYFSGSGLKVGFAAVWAKVGPIALAHVLQVAFAAVLLLREGLKRGVLSWRAVSFPLAKTILKMSLPLAIAQLFMLLTLRSDQMLLGYFGLERELGEYAGAVRLIEPLSFVTMATLSSLTPRLFAAKTDNEFLTLFTELQSLLIYIAFSISAAVFVSADLIASLVYGAKFQETPGYLRVLSLSFPFFVSFQTHSLWSLRMGRGTSLPLRFSLAAVASIGANVLLAPKFGAFASAWITVATSFFLAIVSPFLTGDARLVMAVFRALQPSVAYEAVKPLVFRWIRR
jgi:PST family polysaccharide transporter